MSDPPVPADSGHFWALADRLVAENSVAIDRPKGSGHSRNRSLIYPLDYGYLEGTRGGDGDGIDIWRGTMPGARVTGAIMTLDIGKGDAEVKLLLGCTLEEAQTALDFHTGQHVAGLLTLREP